MTFSLTAFERLALGVEVTPGTAVAADRSLALSGTVRPLMTWHEVQEMTGTIAGYHRKKLVRQTGGLSASGPVDLLDLEELVTMLTGASVSTSNPEVGVDLHEYTLATTGTGVIPKTATFRWGGLLSGASLGYYAAYGFLTRFTFSNDATRTDPAQASIDAITRYPVQENSPSYPAIAAGPLLSPLKIRVYLDTSSGIGTTEITSRVVSAQHTVSTGCVPFFRSVGAASNDPTYSAISVVKRPAVKTTVTLQIPDDTELDQFDAGTTVKLRVRHSGDLITGSSYNFAEFDTYGPLETLEWAEQDGNRLVRFTCGGEYDGTLSGDARIAIQLAT